MVGKRSAAGFSFDFDLCGTAGFLVFLLPSIDRGPPSILFFAPSAKKNWPQNFF
jgi:hypothetical protein